MTDRPFRVRAPQPVDMHAPLSNCYVAPDVATNGDGQVIAGTILVIDDAADVERGAAFAVRRLAGAGGRLLDAPDFDEGLAHLARPSDIDLVLYDVSAPSCDRIAALVRRAGARPVVVFADSGAPEDIRATAEAGAAAYVIKSQPAAVLRHALRLALAGCGYFPADLLLRDASTRNGGYRPAPTSAPNAKPCEALSPLELDILALLLDGLSNRAIAHRLGLDESAIKIRVKALFRRIGVRNRTQAAVFAAHHLEELTRRAGRTVP